MKIEVNTDGIVFIPEDELDAFHLGMIHSRVPSKFQATEVLDGLGDKPKKFNLDSLSISLINLTNYLKNHTKGELK